MASGEAKVALITGASSGIGEATAKLLLKKGYKVAICGSRKEKVDRVLSECSHLSEHNFKPFGMVLDFNEPTNGKLAVEKTLDHFGRIDVLVNNAGMFARTSAENGSTCFDIYRQVMSINLDATVSATLAAVDALKKSQGQVIFVSSTASVRPHPSAFAYCASKAAMSSFAKCLAIELAKQVRINIVSPGPVVTDITKSLGISPETARATMGQTTLEGRAGESHEVAEAVLYLLNAPFVSGEELFIDGGYLLKQGAASMNSTMRPIAKQDL